MQPGISFLADLELVARNRLGGRALEECGQVDPGPYLGAWALCLEALDHRSEARTAIESLRRLATAKSPDGSAYDRSLYAGELATYYAAQLLIACNAVPVIAGSTRNPSRAGQPVTLVAMDPGSSPG